MLNAFFKSNEFDSDERCVEFAAGMLEDFKFLYSDTDDADPSVCLVYLHIKLLYH